MTSLFLNQQFDDRLNQVQLQILAQSAQVGYKNMQQLDALIMAVGRLEGILSEHSKRFETIDKRFDAVDKRFDAIDKRFDAIGSDFKIVWGAIFTSALGLAGLMAKGFGWL